MLTVLKSFLTQITRITRITRIILVMIPVSRVAIACALEVHRSLGCGYLETVYQAALAYEFQLKNISYKEQVPLEVTYKSQTVGMFVADFLLESRLLIEMKAVSDVHPAHEAQLINYLRATGLPVGLLLNFGGRSLQIRRKVNQFDPGSFV